MGLPLRASRKPKHNPPIWAATSTTGIVGLVAALNADGIEVPVQIAIVVTSLILGFASGVIAQFHTTPSSD